MGIKFSLGGMVRFTKNLRILQELPTQNESQITQAVLAEMEIELREVISRTPIDTGALRATEHIEGPEYTQKTIRTAIVAGDEAEVPYALIVHEDLEAFHRVGQAKYISSVLDESGPHLAARIAARIDLGQEVESTPTDSDVKVIAEDTTKV